MPDPLTERRGVNAVEAVFLDDFKWIFGINRAATTASTRMLKWSSSASRRESSSRSRLIPPHHTPQHGCPMTERPGDAIILRWHG
jgi:hypothetical protein